MAARTPEDQARFERARLAAQEAERVNVFRGRAGPAQPGQPGSQKDPLAATGLNELPPLTGIELFDRIIYGLQGMDYMARKPNGKGPK